MKHLYMTLFLLILTVGCGGGGGDSASVEAVSSTPPVAPPIVKTKDLVSNSTFDFNSNYNLRIVVPVKPDDTAEYFINICSNIADNNPVIRDYSSCMVRGFLRDSNQTFELELSESERELVAQIWPMYPGAEAKTYFFNASSDNETWQLSY